MIELFGGTSSPRSIRLSSATRSYLAVAGVDGVTVTELGAPRIPRTRFTGLPIIRSVRMVVNNLSIWMICYILWIEVLCHLPVIPSMAMFMPIIGVTFSLVILGLIIILVIPSRRNHAAEHMISHAIEADAELTPASVMGFSRFHDSCGTNLAVCMLLTMIPVVSVSHSVILALVVGHELFLTIPGGWWPFRLIQGLTTAVPGPENIDLAIRLGMAIRETEGGGSDGESDRDDAR